MNKHHYGFSHTNDTFGKEFPFSTKYFCLENSHDWFSMLTSLCTTSYSFDLQAQCCEYTEVCTSLPNGSQTCTFSSRSAPLLNGPCSTCANIAHIDADCMFHADWSCQTMPDGSQNCNSETIDVAEYCPIACGFSSEIPSKSPSSEQPSQIPSISPGKYKPFL